jgi:hypothetical protein
VRVLVLTRVLELERWVVGVVLVVVLMVLMVVVAIAVLVRLSSLPLLLMVAVPGNPSITALLICKVHPMTTAPAFPQAVPIPRHRCVCPGCVPRVRLTTVQGGHTFRWHCGVVLEQAANVGEQSL